MPGSALPNLGLVEGYSIGDTGWGIGGFNPNMKYLDAIMFLEVISAALGTAPGSPTAGDRYIVATGATGTWSSKDLQLAIYRSGAWAYYPAKRGWRAYDRNTSTYIRFDGSVWVTEAGGGDILYSALVEHSTVDLTASYSKGSFVTASDNFRYMAKADVAPIGSLADSWNTTFGNSGTTKWSVTGLVATATDHNHTDTIIGTKVQNTGSKISFECSVNTVNDCYFGFTPTGTISNTIVVGDTGCGFGFNVTNKNWRRNSSFTGSGMPAISAGDRLNIVIDNNAGKAWIRNITKDPATYYGNGVAGDPVAGTNGFTFTPFNGYVAACSNQNGIDEIFTYEDGSGTFQAAPPLGYIPTGGLNGTFINPPYDSTNWIKTGLGVILVPTTPGMYLIASRTAASSLSLDFTGLSGYRAYKIVGTALKPNTTISLDIQLGYGGTPTWFSGANYYTQAYYSGSGGANGISNTSSGNFFVPVQGISSTGGVSFEATIYPNDPDQTAHITGNASYRGSDGNFYSLQFGGWINAAMGGAMTAVKLIASGGNNFASGYASLYGFNH